MLISVKSKTMKKILMSGRNLGREAFIVTAGSRTFILLFFPLSTCQQDNGLSIKIIPDLNL